MVMIEDYWSDEDPIMCLESIQNGSPHASLPTNVVADINPYLINPQNLPEGIWYVVYWKDPKEAEFGVWKSKGDPCQIYSDSLIIGWRTTLELYQGHLSEWVMQEYSISDIGSTKFKGGTSLCRVFLSEREGEAKKPDEHQSNVADADSSTSVKIKFHAEAAEMEGLEPMLRDYVEGDFLELRDLDEPQSLSSEDIMELRDLDESQSLSYEDILELRDLDEPQSSSSSSDNSSCATPSSDIYFDSDALLQELDDEVYRTNSSSNKLVISRKNDDVAVTVIAQGSPVSDNNNNNNKTVEVPLETRMPEKARVPKDAKTQPKDATNDAGSSSSKGKKVYRGNKMKKFLCFIAC